MGANWAEEEAERRAEAHARAEANRLRIEKERARQLAERSRQLKEQAQRAKEARKAAAIAREKAAQEQLETLQKRWAEADKHVDALRTEVFLAARGRVEGWKERQGTAASKYTSMVQADAKKVSDEFVRKEKKFHEWQEAMEEKRQQKAREVAAVREAASGRFSGELEARTDRLEQAQQLAAERRERTAAERAAYLAERAAIAEQREQEAWEARLRVEQQVKQRTQDTAAICQSKMERAEACLQTRAQALEGRLRSFKRHEDENPSGVFRIAGSAKLKPLL